MRISKRCTNEPYSFYGINLSSDDLLPFRKNLIDEISQRKLKREAEEKH